MTNKKKFPLNLKRPLAFLDIEATGVNPRADRIIELAVCTIYPDGTRRSWVFTINPGIPIPAESSAIHGFKDEDVADCPLFAAKAHEIAGVLDGCDLAGYNLIRYDVLMLTEEMARAGLDYGFDERSIIDAQRIYHLREPRDLTAALAFYCGEMHMGAHGAVADVDATIRVIEGQFEKYKDLPADVEDLARYCDFRRPDWVDRTGKLKWRDGEVVLGFGKRGGERLRDLVANEKGYIDWLLKSNFPRDTQEIVRNALAGRWPEPSKRANQDAEEAL